MLLGVLGLFSVFVIVTVLRFGGHVHHYARHVRHLGWQSGVFAGYTPASDEAFARWRGSAIQTATDFMGSGTWIQIERPLSLYLAWRTDRHVRLVLSVPMWPATGGSLDRVASGTYDPYYRQLASSLVHDGRADTIVRLGWEFNTPFFRWQVKTPAEAHQYAAGWRQAVRSMRSVAGENFQFVWNPDLSDRGIDPALGYPGDVYVDDVGLDVYDRGLKAGQSPAQRWDDLVHQQFGLQWQAQFAAAHHKPVAFPEWGLVHETGSGTDGGDDPEFIRQMHAWFASHNTAFEDYFNDPSADGASFNIDGSEFPKSAAAYRRLFGAPTS